MGILDSLGKGLGKMTAMGQEIQAYKAEYEWMSNSELEREYKALNNSYNTEQQYRRTAIRMILTDRGYRFN